MRINHRKVSFQEDNKRGFSRTVVCLAVAEPLFFLLFLVSGRNSTMCCVNVFGQAMQWVSISPRPDLGQNSCPTTRIVRQGGQRAGKLRCTHCEKLECRVVPWEVLDCISGRVNRRLDLCGGCVQVRISR